MTIPSRRSGPTNEFYAYRLSIGEKKRLAEAQKIKGLDSEIAVLRVLLRDLIENDPKNKALIFKTIDLIVRAVTARNRPTKPSPEDAEQGIYDFLESAVDKLGLEKIPWA